MTDHNSLETIRQAMKDFDAATPQQRTTAMETASAAAATAEAFWTEADIISSYSRADAIADGTLIDADIGTIAEVSRQHFPNAKVAMTPSLLGLIQRAVDHPRWLNDWRGVWHDICWMSKLRNADGLFRVTITGTGRRRIHILKRLESVDTDGTPTVTFMLREED